MIDCIYLCEELKTFQMSKCVRKEIKHFSEKKESARNEIPLAGAFLDGPVLARQHACRSQN